MSEHDFSVIFKISVPQSFDNISVVSCRSSYISQLLPWLVVGLQIPVDISSVATADEAPNRENCTRIFANLECLMNTECMDVF